MMYLRSRDPLPLRRIPQHRNASAVAGHGVLGHGHSPWPAIAAADVAVILLMPLGNSWPS